MASFNRRSKTFAQLDLSPVTNILQIREYYSELGDVHEFVIARDMKREDMSHIVAYIEGSVEVSRSDSPDIIRRVESAGNTSNDYVWDIAPRGKTIHRVISDKYRYYCITDHLFRKMRSKTIRFADTHAETLTPGVLVFIAMGSVEVDGKQLNAPAIFETVVPTPIIGNDGTLILEIEKLN